jgi:hypothetical protein
VSYPEKGHSIKGFFGVTESQPVGESWRALVSEREREREREMGERDRERARARVCAYVLDQAPAPPLHRFDPLERPHPWWR